MSSWLRNAFTEPTESLEEPPKLTEQKKRFKDNETREVPVVRPLTPETAMGWRQVMLAASEGHAPNLPEDSRSIRERQEFLDKYFTPRRMAEVKAEMIPKRPSQPRTRWDRLKRRVVNDRLIPFLLRLAILWISIIGLALAVVMFRLFDALPIDGDECARSTDRPEIIFMVAWPTIAIIFTLVIMIDEFLAPPIGLRPPLIKLGITLADLVFIMLNVANLTIAFTLVSRGGWACVGDSKCEGSLRGCTLLKTLCGFLLLGALTWNLTFSVTLVRLISIVSGFSSDAEELVADLRERAKLGRRRPKANRQLVTEP